MAVKKNARKPAAKTAAKSAAKTKTAAKAKSAKPAATAKPAPRKAAPKKKKPARRALETLENAIEVGAAELDDIAVSMGLLGAVEPAPKRKPKR